MSSMHTPSPSTDIGISQALDDHKHSGSCVVGVSPRTTADSVGRGRYSISICWHSVRNMFRFHGRQSLSTTTTNRSPIATRETLGIPSSSRLENIPEESSSSPRVRFKVPMTSVIPRSSEILHPQPTMCLPGRVEGVLWYSIPPKTPKIYRKEVYVSSTES